MAGFLLKIRTLLLAKVSPEEKARSIGSMSLPVLDSFFLYPKPRHQLSRSRQLVTISHFLFIS